MHVKWAKNVYTYSIAAYNQNWMGATNIFRLTLVQDFCKHDFWLMLRACELLKSTAATTTATNIPLGMEQPWKKGQSIEYYFLWISTGKKSPQILRANTLCSILVFHQHSPEWNIDEYYKLKALDILSVHSYKAYINIWHFFVDAIAHSGMIRFYTHSNTHIVSSKNGRTEWIGKPQRWKTFDYIHIPMDYGGA